MPKNIFQHSYLYLRGYHDDVSIGECYHYGRHVEKNLQTARMYYRQAARRGEPNAFIRLSILSQEEGRIEESLYYRGMAHELSNEWGEALAVYQQTESAGYAPAMYRIGQLYQADRFSIQQQCIIRKDLSQELYWYRKSAVNYYARGLDALVSMSKTEPKAAVQLAQMGESGEIGNKINMAMALMYYESASRMGAHEATYRLGELYEMGSKAPELEPDPKKAFNYYAIIAKQGDKRALATMERMVDVLGDEGLRLQLACIYQENLRNKPLATQHLKYLADRNNKIALDKINNFAESDPEYAYLFAKLYEKCLGLKQKAYFYYALAVRGGHENSCVDIRQLANEGNADAQYIIAYEYCHKRKKYDEAINWCMRAAEQQHSQAITYLAQTQFSVEQYLTIARRYEHGDNVNKNISSAIIFYKKACDLNSKEAATRLGQLYQPDLNVQTSLAEETNSYELEKDAQKSFAYYLIAAKQKDEVALAAMVSIVEHTNDDGLRLTLAQVYLDNFNNYLYAIKCFKYLADKNNNVALLKLSHLAKSNPEYAYAIAKLYEQEKSEELVQKACDYYALALQEGYEAAREALIALGTSGNKDAQYILSEYYLRQKKYEESINWLLLAVEQKHSKAIFCLNETQFGPQYYLMIARKYEEGTGIRKNIQLALVFYKKAFALNNKESALRLGQLYQPHLNPDELSQNDYSEIEKDAKKSFSYYLIAAKQNDKVALEGMSATVEYTNDDNLRLILGKVYQENFNNMLSALRCFKYLADKNNKEALTQINSLCIKNPENPYILAKLYEQDGIEKHIQKICNYYAISLRHAHPASRDAVEVLANKGYAEAQYTLGYEYYHNKKNIAETIAWCMRAADQQHSKAMLYLTETKFSAEYYLLIAQKYETGAEGVKKNIQSALFFYEKAFALDNKMAAIRLGQLYQPNFGGHLPQSTDVSPVPEKSATKAFHYYLSALTQADQPVLGSIIKIAEHANSSELWLELAHVYQNRIKDKLSALKYLRYSADKNNQVAITELNVLAKEDPESAYAIAKLYEEDVQMGNHLEKAYGYYIIALQHHHAASRNTLTALGGAGDMEAQYILGNYYLKNKKYEEAIHWLLLAADQQHPKATVCLKETRFNAEYYLMIGQRYEEGITVRRNILLTLFFYEKAYALNNVEAALRLGQLYQVDCDELPKNNSKAFEYFKKAALLGNRDALAPLERLGEEVSSSLQLSLASMYRDPACKNEIRANYWQEQAGDSRLQPLVPEKIKPTHPSRYSFLSSSSADSTQRGPGIHPGLGAIFNFINL